MLSRLWKFKRFLADPNSAQHPPRKLSRENEESQKPKMGARSQAPLRHFVLSRQTYQNCINSRQSCAAADGRLECLRCLRLRLFCACGCKTDCCPLGGMRASWRERITAKPPSFEHISIKPSSTLLDLGSKLPMVDPHKQVPAVANPCCFGIPQFPGGLSAEEASQSLRYPLDGTTIHGDLGREYDHSNM